MSETAVLQSRKIPRLTLAWRNTLRNGRRTLLTVSAVFVAVGAMIFGTAYMNGTLDNVLDTFAKIESGHIRIRKEGFTRKERSLPLYLHIEDLSRVTSAIREVAGVKAVLPRIRTAVLMEGAESNRTGLLMGVDIAAERGYLDPEAMVSEGRTPRSGHPEVLVGREFAHRLGVQVGDTLTLLGQTAYRSLGGIRLRVTGLAQTGMGAFDGKLLLAPLDQVQLMTEMPDAATELLVFAKTPEEAHRLLPLLRNAISNYVEEAEIRAWDEQGPLIQTLSSVRPVLLGVVFMLTIMAGLVIVNTMLMTVMERTRELGMLAALGMRRVDIVLLIVAEGAMIGLIGAVPGGVAGSGVTLWLQQTGLDITAAARSTDLPFRGVIYPAFSLPYALGACLLGIAAAAAAAVYPALKAARQKPAEALRA